MNQIELNPNIKIKSQFLPLLNSMNVINSTKDCDFDWDEWIAVQRMKNKRKRNNHHFTIIIISTNRYYIRNIIEKLF